MNSNNLVIKQKQTNKQTYKKTESQNSIVRLSFLSHVTDIKIASINSWLVRQFLIDYNPLSVSFLAITSLQGKFNSNFQHFKWYFNEF